MTNQGASQSGWTIWETTIAMSLVALAMLAFGSVFSSSETLVRDTRAKHRAEESLRRSLEALANVVRDADQGTLDGFDAQGVSANPYFARVTGVDAIGKTYGPLEELRWSAAVQPVEGVASPGRILHVRNGLTTLVADNVPSDGFSVRREGKSLVVAVKTYYVVDGHLELAEGTTAVALRN